MTNSQTYGPSQVRDLSESWGMDVPKVKAASALSSGLPEPLVYPTYPTAESHPSASTVFQSHSTLHRALSLSARVVNGSPVSHTTGIGARFSRVRGSTPPTVTCGHDFRPDYRTSEVQRVDTVAAIEKCGT